MEEILNKMFDIDNECKANLARIQEKYDNIETVVNSELTDRKDTIKNKYKFKADIKKKEYDEKLQIAKQEIIDQKNKTISEMKEKYLNDKENLQKKIIDDILEGDEF